MFSKTCDVFAMCNVKYSLQLDLQTGSYKTFAFRKHTHCVFVQFAHFASWEMKIAGQSLPPQSCPGNVPPLATLIADHYPAIAQSFTRRVPVLLQCASSLFVLRAHIACVIT